jgi:hypothetical protein
VGTGCTQCWISHQISFIINSKAHMLPFFVSSIMYQRKQNYIHTEICHYMCSLAVVMLILVCDEVSNTDADSCFSFCCIIIRVANNFKSFRTYISSLHFGRPLLLVGVVSLQRSLTMHNKPLLPLPELH